MRLASTSESMTPIVSSILHLPMLPQLKYCIHNYFQLDIPIQITHMAHDHHDCQPGTLFFAFNGSLFNATSFIPEAINNGAVAVISETELQQEYPVPCYHIPQLRDTWPDFIRDVYGDPSAKMWVSAVTGTNGKTSIAYWLACLLTTLKQPCGYIGTLGTGVPGDLTPSLNTTPDNLSLQRQLALYQQTGHGNASIEASSHGLSQGRLSGIDIDLAIYTHLTHDHLNYHGDMKTYAQAKAKLFAWPTLKTALINADCPYAQEVTGCTQAETFTFGFDTKADACIVPGQHKAEIFSPFGQATITRSMMAEFEWHNLLAVTMAACLKGIPFEKICNALAGLPQIPGRLNTYLLSSGATAVIDFAHTPDAFEHVLKSLSARYDKCTVVFGLGGGRDKNKRPMMGRIAEHYADKIILTSDNSRHEPTEQIIADIQRGMCSPSITSIIVDRASAIETACADSTPGEVILIAGKGHETSLHIGNQCTYFDEKALITPF